MKKETKICSKCGQIKTLDKFTKRLERKIGVRPECKDCLNKRNREKYLKTHPIELLPEGRKKCSKCKEVKEFIDFGKDNIKIDGLKCYCKECRKIECDKQKEKDRKHDWYLNNKKMTIKRAKNWAENNPNKRRKIALKHITIDILNNPHKYAWRVLLRNTLERLKKPKEGHTIDLLWFSAVELKEHLESLFTECMDWGNYGEWHIDHIKEVRTFDKDTPPHIVNALDNLRPLWATTRKINGVVYEGNLNRLRK